VPDWGMWGMRMYNKFGNPYFPDRPCPDCDSQLDDHNTDYNAGTGESNMNGVKSKCVIKYCDKDYHRRARGRNLKNWHRRHTVENIKSMPKKQNIAPFFYPPEHEKILKFAGRSVESAIKARNAQKYDGFLYTLIHPLWPEVKIGFTYNPPSRLGNFNTCCPRRLFSMPYISIYLKNAKLAEDVVHAILKEHRVDGEWFNVSIEIAIKTIEDYVESLSDRKEQALG